MRELSGYQKSIIGAWLAVAALFHLYTSAFGVLEPRLQRSIHVGFVLSAAFILFPASHRSPQDRASIFDIFFALISLAPVIYIIINFQRLEYRLEHITPVTTVEIILGTVIVILLLEAIRRVVSLAMTILIVFFIAYIFISPYLPGMMYFKQISYSRIIERLFLLRDQGIYGSITGISATFIAVFVIFGAFIQGTGVGKFFTDFACRIAGKTRGGPAKIAVVSSGFFGSISGSGVANVYATGNFSIPLMKRLGYSPEFAGAVEATASNGGMFMPPVMGAGAFIMAEITQIPYIKICIAAALGSLLYFVSVGLMVHFQAAKRNISGLQEEELCAWKEILARSYLILPLISLVILLVKGYSPFSAAFYSIIVSFIISFFSKESRMTPRNLYKTLRVGGVNLVMVALACTGAGIVISVVTNTGLGLAISSSIVTLSEGVLLIALILTMLTSLVLGIGLPCTPAYIIAVSVGGPALAKLGVPTLPTHLFVFYFAVLACVTPPVSLCAYAGASVANSNPIKTGFVAFKLALVGFLVPFSFVYSPGLLLQGSLLDIIRVTLFSSVAIVFLAAGSIGWFGRKSTVVERILLLVPVPFLIFPLLPDNLMLIIRTSILIAFLVIIFFGRKIIKSNKTDLLKEEA
jgi:TRAP transporter 4TM/12TM fusion protein